MVVHLYYSGESCGAAYYLAAHAAGLLESGAVVSHSTNIDNHTVNETGANFYDINPKGNVPCLVLPSGVVLNEGPAVMQCLGDLAPASKIVPAAGTDARYLFINRFHVVSELMAAFMPLFYGGDREVATKKLISKFESIVKHDLKTEFFVGDTVSGADYYLYVVLSWAEDEEVNVPLPKELAAYVKKIDERKEVIAANEEMED